MTLVENESDAEDLVQQAALRACEKDGHFASHWKSTKLQYAHAMVRCQALNFLRHKKRMARHGHQTLCSELEFGGIAARDRFESGDKIELINSAMEDLPEHDKMLLEKNLLKGVTSRQLAIELNRSQASVCNSLRRVKDRLASSVTHLENQLS